MDNPIKSPATCRWVYRTTCWLNLLDHWGMERPDVVAHDFGGATALRAHLLNGKDYRSLTLIDPVALTPWGSPFVQHVRQHEAAFSGLPDYIQRAIVPAYIRGAIKRDIPDEELDPYVQPWLGDPGKRRSIGRLRRWMSVIPARPKGCTRRCVARCRFCGAKMISGFPSSVDAHCIR